MEKQGKEPKRIGKSPNCYWCGALKENPKAGLCNPCRAEEARQYRAKKRAEKGLKPFVKGGDPNCSSCGQVRENFKAKYCRSCARKKYREANEKRKSMGLLPYNELRGPHCYDCGKVKENPKKAYCYDCRNRKQRELDLKNGTISSHRKGTCAICKTDWIHKRSCDCVKLVQEERQRKKLEKLDSDFFIKEAARRKTNRAIKAGILMRQPCIICLDEKVDAHHEDYTKPLDVVWICRLHHMQYHSGKISLNKD